MPAPPPHNHREAWTPRATVMQVIQVEFLRGTGCCDESVARIVHAYYDLDGNLLAEVDDGA